jgi:Txe/YoeB family toxin of Txe-Axe toxin-antitoxin module
MKRPKFTLPKDMTQKEVEEGLKETTTTLNKISPQLKKIIEEVNKTQAHSRVITVEMLMTELVAKISLPPLMVIGSLERLKSTLLDLVKSNRLDAEMAGMFKKNLLKSKDTKTSYIG